MNHVQFCLRTCPDSDAYYLVVEIRVDGLPISDFSYFATDLSEALRSSEQSGTYTILTCRCGAAGCVGIDQGVDVRHTGDKVYWHLRQPSPERNFAFDRNQYRQALQTCMAEGRAYIQHLQKSIFEPVEISPLCNRAIFDRPQ